MPTKKNQQRPGAESTGTKRKCLKCSGTFKSEGPANRICYGCKARRSWKDPSGMPFQLPAKRKGGS